MSAAGGRAPEGGTAVSRRVLVGVAVLAGVPAAALLLLVAATVGQRSPFRHGRVGGAFAISDTGGRRVSERDFAGKPLAITFGYTGCPDVCPTTLITLGGALKRMGGDAGRLAVAFVTLDPEHDTAARLRDYLDSFDPRIRGLVGTPAEVAAMADSFHIRYRRAAGGGVDHTAGTALFDERGELVGEISYDASEDAALAKLATLVRPRACLPGAPPRVDLWSGATLGSRCGD